MRVAAEGPEGRIEVQRCDVTDRPTSNGPWTPRSPDSTRSTCSSTAPAGPSTGCSRDKPREEWEREIAIDFWGFINFTRAVLDPMIERGYGRIVSIGSDAGRIGEWREAVYSGTKAGVIAMSKAIARKSGAHNITLNVVCPGFTPGTADASGEGVDLGRRSGAQFSRDIRQDRPGLSPAASGTPEDLVGPVLLLASDRASYVTGQTLSVSGGYTMA